MVPTVKVEERGSCLAVVELYRFLIGFTDANKDWHTGTRFVQRTGRRTLGLNLVHGVASSLTSRKILLAEVSFDFPHPAHAGDRLPSVSSAYPFRRSGNRHRL